LEEVGHKSQEGLRSGNAGKDVRKWKEMEYGKRKQMGKERRQVGRESTNLMAMCFTSPDVTYRC